MQEDFLTPCMLVYQNQLWDWDSHCLARDVKARAQDRAARSAPASFSQWMCNFQHIYVSGFQRYMPTKTLNEPAPYDWNMLCLKENVQKMRRKLTQQSHVCILRLWGACVTFWRSSDSLGILWRMTLALFRSVFEMLFLKSWSLVYNVLSYCPSYRWRTGWNKSLWRPMGKEPKSQWFFQAFTLYGGISLHESMLVMEMTTNVLKNMAQQ